MRLSYFFAPFSAVLGGTLPESAVRMRCERMHEKRQDQFYISFEDFCVFYIYIYIYIYVYYISFLIFLDFAARLEHGKTACDMIEL